MGKEALVVVVADYCVNHILKHKDQSNLNMFHFFNGKPQDFNKNFSNGKSYLILKLTNETFQRDTRVTEKMDQHHTLSPTLHWSRILYKSLPLVTFVPFTDVMMSPKMSLPYESRFVDCKPYKIEI